MAARQDRRAAGLRRRHRRGARRRAREPPPTRWREYGDHLGLAFQLVDDLLGIWGDPAVTGKPIWSDLRQRKKSLPVASALARRRPARPSGWANCAGRRTRRA